MCRGAKTCTFLGDHAECWSREAPLPSPAWFQEELAKFIKSAKLAAAGDVVEARRQLGLIRNSDLQNWYIEHGQMSGIFRARRLGRPKPEAQTLILDPIASPERFANQVFKRDGYRCRYCGIRLIPKGVLEAFSRVVGIDAFRATGTNLQRHGVVLAFRANADHVVPYKAGGRTDLQNLVSCCWCCNYGKGPFTLEQLGLDDPRSRAVKAIDDWDGLSSLQPALRLVASR